MIIGLSPGGRILNQLLTEHNDKKITRKVMSKYNRISYGLNQLHNIKDKALVKHLSKMFVDNEINCFKHYSRDLPDIVMTHSLCV